MDVFPGKIIDRWSPMGEQKASEKIYLTNIGVISWAYYSREKVRNGPFKL